MEPKTTVSSLAAAILAISFTAKLLVLASVILMGANSYAYMALKSARAEKKEYSKLDYFGAVGVAIFSGLMFSIVSLLLSDDLFTAWIAGGMGAFMGVTGITKLGDAFIEMLTNLVAKRK